MTYFYIINRIFKYGFKNKNVKRVILQHRNKFQCTQKTGKKKKEEN